MYIDNTITTEFTGYYDSEDEVYVYPSARQNFLIANGIPSDYSALSSFPQYLSAADGDFAADGISFNWSAGDSTDIKVGSATSASMSGTILNERGYLDNYVFASLCQAWIGVVVSETDVTIPEGASAYISHNGHTYYAIGDEGYLDGTALGFSGTGGQIVSITNIYDEDNTGGDTPMFWDEDGGCWYYVDSDHVVAPAQPGWRYTTSGGNAFQIDKYSQHPQSIVTGSYIVNRSITITTWDIERGKTLGWRYVPMGIFDMSSVSVTGTAYQFEVYDRMTALDADATDWLNTMRSSFQSGTVEDFVMELETAVGLPSSYWGGTSTPNYDVDATFIVSALYEWYTPVTYRQIIEWVGEFCGLNARMSRTGRLEFYQYKTSSSLPTITPDVIVSQSREVSRYTIPQITRLVWYNTIGQAITSGTDGSTYTVTGNPLAEYVTDSQTAIDNILEDSLDNIPVYNSASLTDACADPRVDIGDILTVTRADGTTYLAPIMQYTLTWRGNCVAEYTATGNQTREALTGEGYEANTAQKLASEKVDKAGDTMTGSLVHDYGGTRKSTITDTLQRVENASNSAQNTTQYYNGVVTTDGTNSVSVTPSGVSRNGTAYVLASRTINGKALTSDITLTASDVSAVAKAGDTMTGQLKTSFNESVAMGSYGATATTVPNLAAELRYSSGCAGSANIGTAYTLSGVTIATGWYNFLYMPHRSGGINGTASGDNCNYGTILLAGMTVGDVMYRIRINGGSITECRRICDSSTTGARVTGSATVSLASGTTLTQITSFTLSPGTWHISLGLSFASNATGRRQGNLSTTSGGSAVVTALACNANATNGTQTLMNWGYDITITASTTYYLNAYQNSGSALSTSGYYSAVRII